MPTTLRHPRRARRERRVLDDPAEGRYLRVVEVVRRHKLDRLADDRRAQWSHVADLMPKSEATLMRERALRAMERLLGGRWELTDDVVPSRSRESRMVAAPNPRDGVMDTATALYEQANALAARLEAAEESAATAARLSRAHGPTAIATAERRQVGADLARVVADLELIAAPRHETRTPVHENPAGSGASGRDDARTAATAGSHAA
jgi:hypothetical protein